MPPPFNADIAAGHMEMNTQFTRTRDRFDRLNKPLINTRTVDRNAEPRRHVRRSNPDAQNLRIQFALFDLMADTDQFFDRIAKDGVKLADREIIASPPLRGAVQYQLIVAKPSCKSFVSLGKTYRLGKKSGVESKLQKSIVRICLDAVSTIYNDLFSRKLRGELRCRHEILSCGVGHKDAARRWQIGKVDAIQVGEKTFGNFLGYFFRKIAYSVDFHRPLHVRAVQHLCKLQQTGGMLHRMTNCSAERFRQWRKRISLIYRYLKHHTRKFIGFCRCVDRGYSGGSFNQSRGNVAAGDSRPMDPSRKPGIPFQEPQFISSIAYHFKFGASGPL